MKKNRQQYMRELHRYLGFFLAGIMAIYAISGIVLIFRNTDFLKVEKVVEKKLPMDIQNDQIGKSLRIKKFKVDKVEQEIVYFKEGSFDRSTGVATYRKKQLPLVLDRLAHLHKATTKDPLFFLNIFFGVALLFFVISAFWMFLPSTKTFKKGLYFSLAGIVLVIIMLFV